MRHNGRPPLRASEIRASDLNLRPGEVPAAVCPVCGRWRRLSRHMLWPHRAADGKTRCPGSGQRIEIDISAGEWLMRLEAARQSARRHESMQRAALRAVRQARAASRYGGGLPAAG